MKSISINKEGLEPLQVIIDEAPESTKLIIFVCGSGDTKDVFTDLIGLVKKESNLSVLSFSFRGRETNTIYPAFQQGEDLKDVIDYFKENGFDKFSLVATSMGFISTADVLADSKYSNLIDKVLLIDPADFYIGSLQSTWTGLDYFEPSENLISQKLKEIKSQTIIHQISFALKNFDANYKIRTPEERGIDRESGTTRLNFKMAQNIYNSIPEVNRGVFIIDNKLPHAFVRDGNIDKNIEIVGKYVKDLIG